MIDALFLIDIVLNFCKTYEDPTTKEEIMDHCTITDNYIRSWFVVDLISSIPAWATGEASHETRMFKLMKLLRLRRWAMFITNIEHLVSEQILYSDCCGFAAPVYLYPTPTSNLVPTLTFTSPLALCPQVASHVDPYVIRLLTQLTLFILLHHFVACLYWAIAWQTPVWTGDADSGEEGECGSWCPHTFLDQPDLYDTPEYDPAPFQDRYFFSMYWAVTTTQAGLMGKPVTLQQYLFSRLVVRTMSALLYVVQ